MKGLLITAVISIYEITELKGQTITVIDAIYGIIKELRTDSRNETCDVLLINNNNIIDGDISASEQTFIVSDSDHLDAASEFLYRHSSCAVAVARFSNSSSNNNSDLLTPTRVAAAVKSARKNAAFIIGTNELKARPHTST